MLNQRCNWPPALAVWLLVVSLQPPIGAAFSYVDTPLGRYPLNLTYSPSALHKLQEVFRIKKLPVYSVKKIPPQYMVELYNSVNFDDGSPKTATPFNSNVIRSFPDKNVSVQTQYFYDISFIEPTETILQAEFHLYRVRPEAEHVDVNGRQFMKPSVVTLQIYQILDPAQPFAKNGAKLIAARRLLTTHKRPGWEVFNVTSTARFWRRNPLQNFGFLVTVSTSITLDQARNELPFRFIQRDGRHDSRQPILVIYTDSPQTSAINIEGVKQPSSAVQYEGGDEADLEVEAVYEDLTVGDGGDDEEPRGGDAAAAPAEPAAAEPQRPPLNGYRRWKLDTAQRSADADQPDAPRRSKRSVAGAAGGSGGPRHAKKSLQTVCGRKEMYVDFEEIGWSDWIISPKGYNAFHCKGTCEFPLDKNSNPTNHATVQSIVKAMGIKYNDVANPCCVPDQLQQISLLYFDDRGNVILRKYEDMTVKSCGCR